MPVPARSAGTTSTTGASGTTWPSAPAPTASSQTRSAVFMMNALRLVDGVELELFEARTGLPPAALEPGMQRGRDAGWLVADRRRLAPTARGLDFLNDLLELFLPEAA